MARQRRYHAAQDRYADLVVLARRERPTEVSLTLRDLLPLPATSTANAWHHANVARHNRPGSPMLDGRKFADTEHDAATFEQTPAMRKLRERMAKDLPDFASTTRYRTRERQDDGDVIDPLAFTEYRRGIERDRNYWDATERETRKRTGTVSIACNFGLVGSEPTTNLEWSGAAALALADLLDELGYSVELYGVITSFSHPSGRYDVTVELKRADDRLSQSAIALVSSGSVRRRVWWSYLASRPERTGENYGIPTEYIGSRTFDITIPKSITSQDDAVAFVLDEIDRLTEMAEED